MPQLHSTVFCSLVVSLQRRWVMSLFSEAYTSTGALQPALLPASASNVTQLKSVMRFG